MTGVPFEGWKSAYPPGAIVIWTRPVNDLPEGWLVCDGNNGTPDLRSRFIRSVPNGTTDPGSTGGQNTFTLSTSQIPAHDHYVSFGSTGSHHNDLPDSDSYDGSLYDTPSDWDGSNNGTTSTDGSHSHSFTTTTTGSGSSISNEPPYYEVVFIQKA